MNAFRTTFVFSALLALCVLTTGIGGAEASSTALFTNYEPYLCVGDGFVALAGVSANDPLVVIPIDVNGIEAPKTMSQGHAGGLQCSGFEIKQLGGDSESSHLILRSYAVEWHSGSPSTIREKEPLEIPLPRTGPLPAGITYMKESFIEGNRRAWFNTRGDWYVSVPDVADRPNNIYEVHFVRKETIRRGEGLQSEFAVDLLEETIDRKVTRSVPLVKIERFEAAD